MNIGIRIVFNTLFRSRCALCLEKISFCKSTHALNSLCETCFYEIENTLLKEAPRCTLCLTTLTNAEDSICSNCSSEQYLWNSIGAITSYKGALQHILTEYKYQYKLSYVPILAHYLNSLIEEKHRVASYDFILPIPLHKNKLQKRGFHQIWELIKHKKKEYPLCNKTLLSKRKHSTQMSLSLEKRIDNVSDIFIVSKNITNASILLVDDVITTGLTTTSAVQVLKKAGALKVDCIALCHNDTINKEALNLFMNKEIPTAFR